MGFYYANMKEWNKKAISGFVSAILALIPITLAAAKTQDMFIEIIIIGLIPVSIGLLQGIYFMNRTSRDYIFLEASGIVINRGPFMRRKRINYRDIDHCLESNEGEKRLITISVDEYNGTTFHGEWLTEEDLGQLKKELMKRTRNEKLFRISTEMKPL